MNQQGGMAPPCWQGTTQVLQRKTCPSATTCTTNLTRTGLGSNLGLPCTLSRAPNFGTKFHPDVHVVSKELGPPDTCITSPRQTTPKILVTHDTDTVALHSVFWMTSQVMSQKRSHSTTLRNVQSFYSQTVGNETDQTIIDFFTASILWWGSRLQGDFRVDAWICLTNSSCPLFSCLSVTINRTSRHMQHHPVRAWLDNQYSGWWIRRRGQTEEPPQSPDINPSDLNVKWFISVRPVQRRSADQIANTGCTEAIHTFEALLSHCPSRPISENETCLCVFWGV